MATLASSRFQDIAEDTYKKRIRSWTLYDWANSAFATTILAAMLPVYYSSVAGATLPTEAIATAYWSLTLSISLFIVAILSPILGTVSDVMRGKKRFLSIFIGFGVVATGLLVFVGTGDWLLASILFILGRIGFGGANVFYDALLPHVAREEDQDAVSTRGYAMGYLGGGILLAINVVMFISIPDSLFENAGVRLSFLSVGIWWLVWSIPILRNVPEPPSASAVLSAGQSVIGESLSRLRQTFPDLRQYGELFKFLVAFLIYNDAIGTIIGLAAIYGAELGFGTLELVAALLLVQFAGIPFSLIFGRLPDKNHPRRAFFLAYILFNLVALPLVGILGAQLLPTDITGNPPPAYETVDNYFGQGSYVVGHEGFLQSGEWEDLNVSGDDLVGEGLMASLTTLLSGRPDDVVYAQTQAIDSQIDFALNGQAVEITHSVGPDHGVWAVEVDGELLTTTETVDNAEVETPVVINMYNETPRFGERTTISVDEPGQYTLSLINIEDANGNSTGNIATIVQLEVLQPIRQSSLVTILGILLAIQVLAYLFARTLHTRFQGLAETLDTRRSILLSLLVYGVVATWGFILNATIEFWLLAFMVAIVQGGSQALSRSFYASLSPASKSGEFFGFFSIMSKFSAITGPLLFALAVALFGSSRPAILSLIALFFIGGFLLTRVDVEKGQRLAREEDAKVFGSAEATT